MLSLPALADSDTLPQTEPQLRYDLKERESVALDTDQLALYRQDKAFNYLEVEVEESRLDRIRKWLYDLWTSFWRWLLGSKSTSKFFQVVIQLLPYLLMAALLGLLVWLLSKMEENRISQKQVLGNGINLKTDEELIQHTDLQSLVNEAVSTGNYRLAIRYSYLLVLQQLSQKELIKWQDQKTNDDYLRELKSAALKSDFAKITNMYDFIWYGNFELDEIKYSRAMQTFDRLKNAL
ncbi:DUF4129 domain-containing protein [Pararhodonellum marinum]|uniref:DUF4129 domain-containing protein n=1 Tax=Pararhodonellum marinum TaxID=2755358 RepID=UPI00188E5DAD|nr:DUF4129 domain-containing protein [Pararhodonellum marinum]